MLKHLVHSRPLNYSNVYLTDNNAVLRKHNLFIDDQFESPLARRFGFSLAYENSKCFNFYVETVENNSPASRAGLRPGDRLIEVDGISISNKSLEQVLELINEAKLRSKLKLLVLPVDVVTFGKTNFNYVGNNTFKKKQPKPVNNNNHANVRVKPELRKEIFVYHNPTHLYNIQNGLSSRSLNRKEQINDLLRPVPRLCTIYKRNSKLTISSNIGFGIKSKQTTISIPNYLRISIVNYKSPAYLSGLEAGDFIVEINGRNTLSMTINDALYFIKSLYEINNHVKLLVVSEFCYNWLREHEMLDCLCSTDSNVFSYADYLNFGPIYVPRLCKIKLSSFNKSFGFTLDTFAVNTSMSRITTTNQSYAHIISEIEPGSPSYLANLKIGDRIIECNSINIENENQSQFIDKLYQLLIDKKQVDLFVIDPEADKYFKIKCIKLHSMLPIVEYIENTSDI
jgi:C-terminal processing protease CtpA/Prc